MSENFRYKLRLPVRIRDAIVGISFGKLELESRILIGNSRILAEGVAKYERPSPEGRLELNRVDLMSTSARDDSAQISPLRKLRFKLGDIFVSDRLKSGDGCFDQLEIGDSNKDVDHGLRAETRDRGAAYVVDGGLGKHAGDRFTLADERRRPLVRVGHDDDRFCINVTHDAA